MYDHDNTRDRDQVMKAVEVLFPDPAAARCWLTTYNPDLGAKPMDCLETEADCEQVMATIGRFQHGVFD